ncbi:MAG: hypothetical protein E7430_06930 [Ruminococcaceae bacterium]|nr:hypothetical protein [Oscillospiraceae bacterium]
MSFVNEILGTASELFEKAAQKSTYYAQIAKLNVKITAENNSLKELYTQLGKAYFEGIESGETESAEFAKELCEKIVESKGKIESYQEEIEQLKEQEAAAAAAAAEAKAEKKAAAEAAKAAVAEETAEEDEIEITIEVIPEAESVAEEVAAEVEAIEAEVEAAAAEPPVATLYVDESAESENKE